MAKFFSFFKKRPSVAEQIAQSTPLEDELRQLTDQVLENSKKTIWEDYRKHIASYNADDNPLGEVQARRILEKLIQKAISNRKMLNANIERSISEGSLYQRYYNKVALINSMTNDTYTKMKRMQGVQERFEYKKRLYNNVTGHMYIDRMVRIAQQPADDAIPVDVGEEIDRVGGVLDECEAIE